ncbi:diguanylate cyclase domain-containing protein [Thalassiella azotivora]
MPLSAYRIYVVLAVATTLAYATVVPPGVPDAAVYCLGALSPVVTIELGLRRGGLARRSWRAVQLGTACMGIGNIAYSVRLIAVPGAEEDIVSTLFFPAGFLLNLVGLVTLLRARRRSDPGGVVDSMILSVVAGGVLWQYVLQPELGTSGDVAYQLSTLVRLLVLVAMLGAMLRLYRGAGFRNGALGLVFGCLTVAFLGYVGPAALDVPDDVAGPWVVTSFLASYFLLGAAALHPAAGQLHRPGDQQPEGLSVLRLVLLGAALLVTPVLGAVGDGGDGHADAVRVAVVSALVVPLVLARFAVLMRERARAEAALAHQASHDQLTGLVNRGRFLERLQQALDRLGTGQTREVVVLFVDLDGFKRVNDELGHEAGDALLVAAADRIRASVRPGDVVARFGGDEFLVLWEDGPTGSCQGTPDVVERIHGALGVPVVLGEHRVPIRASVGATAVTAATWRSADEVIRDADARMYVAKRAHRAAAAGQDPLDGGPGRALGAPAVESVP